MTSQKTTRITAEADLVAWLNERANFDPMQDASLRRSGGGHLIIKILNEWSETYRYIAVAFRDGDMCFTSLPACAKDFGIEVDVRIPDARRYDLVALARGFP